ncbi:hypothetical protein GNI_054470 [Gregarina niphandrodes]|uniref:Transmembrane protein n=1 Tax=Gregarina niphandrodes TaxID=110365 RepID=A0A023B911_GRENI|nr:hypothetical protein GNI_054470 [Gregarina niphandrodes]EZG70694.1 hypothetical protein GNI_054470 [Gregarina niphandrodes]|eukprot:XP_011129877.1 hypothetical protein GNI_054470 [Gregarina niphandrodes]
MRFGILFLIAHVCAVQIQPVPGPLAPKETLSIKEKAPNQAAALKEMQTRVENAQGVPWWRQQLFAALMPTPELRTRMAERQAARWAWYGRQWPTNIADRGVVHYRARGGNLTIAFGVSEDPRFWKQGYYMIQKGAFYKPTNIRMMSTYYSRGTRSLKLYADIFGKALAVLQQGPALSSTGSISTATLSDLLAMMGENLGRSFAELVGRRKGSNRNRNSSYDEDDEEEEEEEEEEDQEDFFGPWSRVRPLQWVAEQVVKRQSLSALNALAAHTTSLLKMMRLFELPAKGSHSPVPHPGFLDLVPLNKRLHDTLRLETVAVQLRQISLDFTVPGRKQYYSSLQSMGSEARRLTEQYEKLLGKYGDHYAPDYYRGVAQRVSGEDERSAKRLKATLKALPEKVAAAGALRPDGLPATLQLTFGAQPVKEYNLRLVGRGKGALTPKSDAWRVSHAFREGPEVEMKYRKYEPLIELAFEKQLARAYLHSATQPVQLAGSSKQGLDVTATFRTQLLCYYDNRVGDARMLELLQVALPGVDVPKTDAKAAPPPWLSQLVTPSLDDLWVTVGAVHDSWQNADRGVSRVLLEAYLRDQLEQQGRMTLAPSQYVSLEREPLCHAHKLTNTVMPFMSTKGKLKSQTGTKQPAQVAPGMELQNRKNGPAVPAALYDAYATCLNMFPVGTEAFLFGENKPANRRPSFLSRQLDDWASALALEKKELTGGIVGTVDKQFYPAVNMQQVAEARYDPAVARRVAQDLQRRPPGVDAAGLRNVQTGLLATVTTPAPITEPVTAKTTPGTVAVAVPPAPNPADYRPADLGRARTGGAPFFYAYSHCAQDGQWTRVVRISQDDFNGKTCPGPAAAVAVRDPLNKTDPSDFRNL